MKPLSLIFISILFFTSCTHSQTNDNFQKKLIGSCEGCEAVFEYGDQELKNNITLPGFNDGELKIKISGTIYRPDGATPAEDVILYIYHTDKDGIYANKYHKKNWERRHGYLRGWIKTGADGRYTFNTIKPGIYPNRAAPAHIHATILEPAGKYYWIEDYYFSGDTLLTERELNPAAPRGGTNGVLELKKEGNLWVAEKNIILGKHVNGY